MQFFVRNSSSNATASAAPSSGAVPVPISSTSTREFGVAASSMVFKFNMCAEKVDKSAAIDCSSPMSTSTWSNSGRTARCAATGIPDCAASAAIPVVFSATVLPPVFGPLITRTFQSQFICFGELRDRGVKIPRESRPRKHAVEFRNRPTCRQERPADNLQLLRELAQNPHDFRGFVLGKLHELVVRIDGFERLHEYRFPRRARSVHPSRKAPPCVGPYGNHETIVPQRDVIFSRLRIPRAQNLLQILLDRFASLRDARSDSPQHR